MRATALTIRTRILAFQLAVVLALMSLVGAGLLANRSFDAQLARGALAHRQLEAITSLASNADRYSEAVSVMLTSGMVQRPAIAALHSAITLDLNRLERITQEEHAFLRARGWDTTGESELARASELYRLYSDLNLNIEALLAMRNAGQGELASAIFFREIDKGLDDSFERLVAEAVADEMSEIATADTQAQLLARRFGILFGGTAAVLVLGILVAGARLYRVIVEPIRRLSAGAAAVGEGDLAARIGPLGGGEFGALAHRFDAMVERIDEQQRQLAAAHGNLEAEVRARTAELEAANRRLEDLDRSRRQFLADVSHELRTPLTVLRGEAEVGLRGREQAPESYRDTLSRILDQARDMGRLVEDVMVLARFESDEIRFESLDVDLGAVAAEAAREAGLLARSRDVRIAARIEAGTPVTGDPQRLKQVFMILLDNALKYSERGSAIVLSVRPEDGEAAATIRNRSEHGRAEELPRVFDRLYRGRDAASQGQPGDGLGLTIARWLVEKQGGSIALARRAETIEVSLRFPLRAAEDGSAQPPRAAVADG